MGGGGGGGADKGGHAYNNYYSYAHLCVLVYREKRVAGVRMISILCMVIHFHRYIHRCHSDIIMCFPIVICISHISLVFLALLAQALALALGNIYLRWRNIIMSW